MHDAEPTRDGAGPAMHDSHGLFLGASTTSFLASVQLLWKAVAGAAPPLEVLPSVMLSLASLTMALISLGKYLDQRSAERARASQRLRHSEDLHRARLAGFAVNGPRVERLDDRP